jgi:hypothetical protein
MEGIEMTREQTKEAIRVMQAFVDGKEVQSVSRTGTFWTSNKSPSWNWADEDFQIKPTKTLRPWTADEVPLGAWMREKQGNDRGMFLMTHTGDQYYRIQLMSEYEHSIDGGKTWKPCGVEEESK